MNDSIVRKFCESPRRSLIVTIVTILLGLVVLAPLVDDYFDNREAFAVLEGELVTARQEAEQLPQLQETANKVEAQLELQESRCVTEKNLSDYRSRLVELVRESGCQIRRLELSAPILAPWNEGDNPIEGKRVTGSASEKTPFVIEHRNVNLSVNGRTAGIYDLLEKLQHDTKVTYPEKVEIISDGQNGEELMLELELWLFALTRQNS